MKKELKRQGKAKIPGAPVPYDRTTIQPGIVHIGVGNFHRAHEEFYTNQLPVSYTHLTLPTKRIV